MKIKALIIGVSIPFSILFGQTKTSRIVFDLKNPALSSVITGSFKEGDSIDIRLRGIGSNDCKIEIDGFIIDCAGVQDKMVKISGSGKIDQTQDIVDYPFSIKLNNNGIQSSIKIPPEPNGSNPENKPESRRNSSMEDIILKACEASGSVLLWRDAALLEKAISSSDEATTKAILCKYVHPDISCDSCILKKSYKSLRDSLVDKDKNPFFKAVLPSSFRFQKSIPESNSNSTSQAGDTKSPIASPSVALDAIASFIAKRFVDELNRAYLDQFRAYLNRDDLKDLKTILPQTKALLSTIGQDYTLDYKSLLTGLRQNFFEDLSHLPLNAPGLLKNHKDTLVKKNPELYISGLAMLEVVNSLQENADLPEIISRLGEYDYSLGQDTSNTLSMVQLVAKISNHLRLNYSSGPWIDINKDFQKPRVIGLFAGLLYKHEENFLKITRIKHNNNWTRFYDFLQQDETQTLVNLIHQSLGLITDVKGVIETEDKNTNAINQFLVISEKLLNFVASNTFSSNAKTILPQKNKAVEQIKILIRIQKHIEAKEFVAAGTQIFTFVESIKGDTITGTGKKEFFRYLSFAQNLIDAKTKEELMEALEQAADPVGSYRNKRYYPMTVSVTAYPGLFGGKEEYRTDVSKKTMFNTGGFTAPLGLAVSFANQDKGAGIQSITEENEAKASFSLFLPILDVGAITSFRLVNQSAEIPDYQWSNFISPGIFGDWGFKNSPLNLHFGLQYGPEIKKVKDTPQPRLWRMGVGMTVDLHLLSIYNKPFRKPTASEATKTKGKKKSNQMK